jgi:hypothetical protein
MKKTTARAVKPDERNAAAILAAEARSAGLLVTADKSGGYRIMGPARNIPKIHWRSPSVASEQIEIVLGPIIRGASRGKPADSYAPGPKGRALLLGRTIKESDLQAADGTFSLNEVMAMLQISRQAVDKKVKQDALLAVPGPSNERRYPVCQFRPDGVVPGLRAVLRALPSRDPWFRLNFLVNPEQRLNGQRPCDVLQRGNPGLVIAAADRVGEMGG